MKTIQFILCLTSISLLTFCQGVSAFSLRPVTDLDFAKLPPYCKARLRGTGPERKYWSKRLYFKNFTHLHHYCNSLHQLNQSFSVTGKDERNRIIQSSLGGLKSVQEGFTEDCYLRPELGNKLGNAYFRLGNMPKALKEFSNGIKLYPKYILNYVGLSKICKKQGDITKAKEILEEGLKHNPSSKLLKKRLKRLEK